MGDQDPFERERTIWTKLRRASRGHAVFRYADPVADSSIDADAEAAVASVSRWAISIQSPVGHATLRKGPRHKHKRSATRVWSHETCHAA